MGVPTPAVPLPSDDGWLLDLGRGGADTEALAALSLATPGQLFCLCKTWQHVELHFEGV